MYFDTETQTEQLGPFKDVAALESYLTQNLFAKLRYILTKETTDAAKAIVQDKTGGIDTALRNLELSVKWCEKRIDLEIAQRQPNQQHQHPDNFDLDDKIRHIVSEETKQNFENINSELSQLTDNIASCENRIESELAKVAENLPDTEGQKDINNQVKSHEEQLNKITNRVESLELSEREDVVVIEGLKQEETHD